MRRLALLVVTWAQDPRQRATVEDSARAFARHGRHRCVTFNALRPAPARLARAGFDLVVFHTSFLSIRWLPDLFARARENVRPLARLACPKVALPQDEFLRTDLLADFFREARVDAVLSLTPEVDWPTIYPGLEDRCRQVLAGYLEPARAARLAELARTTARTIDVGYRAWHAAPWLGRHARLKVDVAGAARDAAARLGLRADISTDARDVFLGDDWYRFLARCRCVVGVEGGASIADRDGALKARTEAYLAEHPGAPFEEVEAACFPGRDGELNLRVITPRHLECCATRTAQVLVEGDYNGVLRPGVHYIPVKRDLSDMAAALRQALDPAVNERITTRAYEDVVASGDWTYARLVREAVEAVRDRLAPAPRTALGEAWASGVHAVLSADERLAWQRQVVLPRAVWELRARLGLLDLRARGRRLLERARGATPPS